MHHQYATAPCGRQEKNERNLGLNTHKIGSKYRQLCADTLSQHGMPMPTFGDWQNDQDCQNYTDVAFLSVFGPILEPTPSHEEIFFATRPLSYQASVYLRLRKNYRCINRNAGSPIERALLHCFNVESLLANGAGSIINDQSNEQQSFENWLAADVQFHPQSLQWLDEYLESPIDESGRRDFIKFVSSLGLDEPADYCGIVQSEHFGCMLMDFNDAGQRKQRLLRLTLQPKFFDLLKQGTYIQPDAVLWRSGDESPRIVVECDGYEFHTNKSSFAKDRLRDRTLSERGFSVRRYSGSEIFADPLACANDLVQAAAHAAEGCR